jgi:hypothetical protein
MEVVNSEPTVQSSSSTEVAATEGPQQLGEDGTTQLPLQMTLDLENHPNRTQIENFQREIHSMMSNIHKTKLQLDSLVEMKNLELQKVNEIIDFMFQVQNFLWSSDDQTLVSLGSPLGPFLPKLPTTGSNHSNSTEVKDEKQVEETEEEQEEGEREGEALEKSDSGDFGLSMRFLGKNYDVLLPPGLRQIKATAESNGILEVLDVQHIIESFRWINWCSLTMHLLRYPPATPLFRKAMDSLKTIQVFDDKISKTLNNIFGKIR